MNKGSPLFSYSELDNYLPFSTHRLPVSPFPFLSSHSMSDFNKVIILTDSGIHSNTFTRGKWTQQRKKKQIIEDVNKVSLELSPLGTAIIKDYIKRTSKSSSLENLGNQHAKAWVEKRLAQLTSSVVPREDRSRSIQADTITVGTNDGGNRVNTRSSTTSDTVNTASNTVNAANHTVNAANHTVNTANSTVNTANSTVNTVSNNTSTHNSDSENNANNINSDISNGINENILSESSIQNRKRRRDPVSDHHTALKDIEKMNEVCMANMTVIMEECRQMVAEGSEANMNMANALANNQQTMRSLALQRYVHCPPPPVYPIVPTQPSQAPHIIPPVVPLAPAPKKKKRREV
ncbi:hypothetical protein BDB01DRAFT_837811 [Pilobolus umbonatus]|nr:hypothetical protein BDB01DRAFT_837811 [Pilobolus umbonatus]